MALLPSSQPGNQAPAILLLWEPVAPVAQDAWMPYPHSRQEGGGKACLFLKLEDSTQKFSQNCDMAISIAARKSGKCSLCSHHVPGEKLGDRYQSLPHPSHLWALKTSLISNESDDYMQGINHCL